MTDKNTAWYLKPITVIFLLFFVLGPFGLPLLYKSPEFSKGLKIILTLIVLFYTAFFVFIIYFFVQSTLESIDQLLGPLNL